MRMKIEDKRKPIQVSFGELLHGEVFEYEGLIYMKTIPQSGCSAVILGSGCNADFGKDVPVTLVNAKLVIGEE